MTKAGLFKQGAWWMETYTGKIVNPMHMDDKDIDIKDIAFSLSKQCRFNGQCKHFYSVAEHSILVCNLVAEVVLADKKLTSEECNCTCLAALLHDAAEAYLGDLIRPVKQAFPQLVELEQVILGKILAKYKALGADWNLIKKTDNAMLAAEARELMPSGGKDWELPEEAPRARIVCETNFDWVADLFLIRFKDYSS